MSKTLLVLAASTYQISAIKTAKRLGYRVITADNVPSNPGHAFADASFNIDTTDADAVVAMAEQQAIDGVLAPGTDVAVVTAAIVAERLRLPGPSAAAARVLTDKQAFRKFLSDSGKACPLVMSSVESSAFAPLALTGRRWLLKPNRSSGSKGVFIVRSSDEIAARLAETRSFSVDAQVILEEFIEGSQHTCEGVLRHGEIALALITDRDTASDPHTATTGHRVPSRLTEAQQDIAHREILAVFAALQVSDGPFDCDFVMDAGRAVLIEATPRLGGNSLSQLFETSLGVDLVAYAVSHACGDHTALPPMRAPSPAAVVILGVEHTGRLNWDISQLDRLKHEPWVRVLTVDFPRGSLVQAFVNGRQRVGEALVTGANRAELDDHLIELKRRLDLRAA